MAKTPPKQQPPPVQRVNLRYTKTGRARFASHRDFSRAFERALRRAEIPMAFSSGYSPHPRISYVNAVPTGASSLAEYLQLGLAQPIDPVQILERLNVALPDGFRILVAAETADKNLAEQLTHSLWEIAFRDINQTQLAVAVDALWASTQVNVAREVKAGMREFEVRHAIQEMNLVGNGVVRAITDIDVPLVRPDDIVQALRLAHGEFAPKVAVFTRLEMGVLRHGRVEAVLPADYVR